MAKNKEFLIYGTYSIYCVEEKGKAKVKSVNLNPQQTYGKNYHGLPIIKLKDNEVFVNWKITKFDFKENKKRRK